jgi:hypothetical protein
VGHCGAKRRWRGTLDRVAGWAHARAARCLKTGARGGGGAGGGRPSSQQKEKQPVC